MDLLSFALELQRERGRTPGCRAFALATVDSRSGKQFGLTLALVGFSRR